MWEKEPFGYGFYDDICSDRTETVVGKGKMLATSFVFVFLFPSTFSDFFPGKKKKKTV